jgi:hypothetical protein
MKTTSNYRKTFVSLLATGLFSAFLLVACDKNDDDIDDKEQKYSLSGNATGAKEIPANNSTGTATITGTFNATTNTLVYTISWAGLSGNLTAAHFHGPASSTETAGPMLEIPVGTNGTSGSTTNSVIVTNEVEAALLGGRVYYNLHTAQYPNGEVRSQVTTSAE